MEPFLIIIIVSLIVNLLFVVGAIIYTFLSADKVGNYVYYYTLACKNIRSVIVILTYVKKHVIVFSIKIPLI